MDSATVEFQDLKVRAIFGLAINGELFATSIELFTSGIFP
jgi:hypothetical protein